MSIGKGVTISLAVFLLIIWDYLSLKSGKQFVYSQNLEMAHNFQKHVLIFTPICARLSLIKSHISALHEDKSRTICTQYKLAADESQYACIPTST